MPFKSSTNRITEAVLNSAPLSDPHSFVSPAKPFSPKLPSLISPCILQGGGFFCICVVTFAYTTSMGPEDRLLPTDAKMKQIKMRRTTNIFKVALFMLRRGKKSSKSSMHTDVASKGLWRKLLGATRPLHLEDKKSSSPSAPHPAATKAATIVPEDDQPPQPAPLALINVEPAFITVEEEKTIVPLPRDNPQGSPSSASTSSGCEESRYASALNLRELDICDEEDDEEEDCQFDDSAGDSMIDVKAEMFIAQFYEQMRLQNSHTATYQMIRG
ncbi:hypothetical protein QQ045_007362 [Rhodiola kirilowii]